MNTSDSEMRLWSHRPGLIIKRRFAIDHDQLEARNAAAELAKDIAHALTHGGPKGAHKTPPLWDSSELCIHVECLDAGDGRHGQWRAQFWFPHKEMAKGAGEDAE